MNKPIMNAWRLARPAYKNFVNDGILIEKDWKNASSKICFLLKESNDDFIEISGHEWGPYGSSNLFWRNLRIWRHVIMERRQGNCPVLENALSEKELPLSDIAYVNLKKNAECKSKSYDPDIQSYVDNDWSFIFQQIQCLNPDVILCCGTFKYIQNKLGFKQLNSRVYSFGSQLFVDFYHPSGRKGYETTFNELSELLKK